MGCHIFSEKARRQAHKKKYYSLGKDRENFFFAIPQTMMNESGKAILALSHLPFFLPQETVLLIDDLDLPFGTVRFRSSGSSGGHHGLESIFTALHTTALPRFRIGIGRPRNKDEVVSFVLSPFQPEEKKLLPLLLARMEESIIRLARSEYVHTTFSFLPSA